MGIAITSWDKRGALGALTRSKNEPISDVRSFFYLSPFSPVNRAPCALRLER